MLDLPSMIHRQLELADLHIAQLEQEMSLERDHIDLLSSAGEDTNEATERLARLQRLLATLQQHRALLLEMLP